MLDKFSKEEVIEKNKKLNRELIKKHEALEKELKKLGVDTTTKYRLSPPLGSNNFPTYNKK